MANGVLSRTQTQQQQQQRPPNFQGGFGFESSRFPGAEQGFIRDAEGNITFGTALPGGGFLPGATALTPDLRTQILTREGSQPAQEFAESALSELFGISGEQLGLQREQLGLQREQLGDTRNFLNRLLGISERSEQFGRERFGEVSPIRAALIGGVGTELGVPFAQVPFSRAFERQFGRFPTRAEIFEMQKRTTELFGQDISGELEQSERGLGQARESILRDTPSRGGQLAGQLGAIPLERNRIRVGLTRAANEVRRQRVGALAQALGLEAPGLAFAGLQGALGGTGQAAGISAGLTGQLGGLGAQFGQQAIGALGTALGGATTLTGQSLAQALGLAELSSRERIAGQQAEGAKKGGTGQGVGAGVGGIIIAIAI